MIDAGSEKPGQVVDFLCGPLRSLRLCTSFSRLCGRELSFLDEPFTRLFPGLKQ
jgi:hypothetical protein